MTEPWHDECRRLRAGGLTQREIAARLKQTSKAVYLALNESAEEKIRVRRAMDRARQRANPRDRTVGKNSTRVQTYWTARAAAPSTITPEIKREAILAFSRHEIDRIELMKRITPREKWAFLVE
jgi:hypothetical protein